MSGHQAQVPQVIADYYKRFMLGGSQVHDYEAHPLIAQTYAPHLGWRTYSGRKRVSCSWLRKLRREGVTVVAVSSPYWPNRTIDFDVAEVLRGGVSR